MREDSSRAGVTPEGSLAQPYLDQKAGRPLSVLESALLQQLGRLKLKEVKQHDQSHTARKWFKWPTCGAGVFYCLSKISFFWLHHLACGILVPQPGIEPCSGGEES
ncbi:unnamed protein product [Rangifer tarandus platyrhynchus]|uniref:Uncharacterized protein n=1 Tax=Rangifer tarandus platyrhynchus TaxID=3082113 RepID=A0AC59Z546_RANTA